ncbi:patatin-related protein [Caballeronia udeis]|uniref:Patatin-related protein n=1 Tax=Caballeronia udeis TaxID=1232866 RepID=A0ABW8MTG7_9BURK
MPDEQREELRLALVMNGGVSLAVWMGGVTNEIFRLVKGLDPVYTGLLDMTQTDARVDVISGTSAGGINGAALGIAMLYEGDFSELRQVWQEMGAFDDLLRPPLGENPGSLLRGDDYFLPQIKQAFTSLARNNLSPIRLPGDMPLDLRLTTTLLDGCPSYTVDDLGSPVGDMDYLACFHFTRDAKPDDFSKRDSMVEKLSRAARSTASFPFAFEPSGVGKNANLCNSQGDALASVSTRYVIDGGILDNKPFRGALQAIFQMPTQRGVRRVLAYVNPDPGDGSSTTHSATPDAPPELAPVLAASVLGIPQSQTISDQLQEIQDHNHSVRTRRNDVLKLVRSFNAATLLGLAENLFPLYRKHRIADTFETFVYSALPDIVRKNPSLAPALSAVGKNGREMMRLKFEAIEWKGWIPVHWSDDTQFTGCADAKIWEWGLSPVEFSASVLLNLLRLTQRLFGYVVKSGAMQLEEQTSVVAALKDLWAQAFKMVDLLADQRKREDREWDKKTRKLLIDMSGRVRRRAQKDPADPPTAAEEATKPLVNEQDFVTMFEFLDTPSRREQCGDKAYRIARLIRLACPVASEVITGLSAVDLNAADQADRSGVQALVEFLSPPLQAPADPLCATLYRMLQLEVIKYAFADRDQLSDDALIELVQISGNSSSPVGGKSAARDKLLGLQLGHFGAFYKKSWRANDWIYGRLDGSERLLKVLLNPERLRRVYSNPAQAVAAITSLALTSVASAALQEQLKTAWTTNHYTSRLNAELAFLGIPGSDMPDLLPVCSEVVTLRIHYEILLGELRNLCECIIYDQELGADSTGEGAACLRQLTNGKQLADPTPALAQDALRNGLIGGERLLDEAGSDMFTRTLAHTVATTQAALSSKNAKLGPLSMLFASVRVPVLGFYFVARGLTHQSRTSAALNGGILATGVVLVLTQLFMTHANPPDDASYPHLVVVTGWTLFAYGIFFSVLRAPRTVGAAILILTIATASSFHLPGVSILTVLTILFILSIWSVLLQDLIGVGAIIVAGLWGSEQIEAALCNLRSAIHLPGNACSAPFHPGHPVFVLSLVVAATLSLATWQAAPMWRKFEDFVAQRFKKRRLP